MTSDPLGPFGDLAAIGAVFARTRGALDTVLHRGGVDDEAGTVLSEDALPHVESLESAFRVTLRTGDADLEQLRGLIRLGGLRPLSPLGQAEGRAALIEAMRALSGAGGERRLVRPAGRRSRRTRSCAARDGPRPTDRARGCPLPGLGQLRRHRPAAVASRVHVPARGGRASPLAWGDGTSRGPAPLGVAPRVRVLRQRGSARHGRLRTRIGGRRPRGSSASPLCSLDTHGSARSRPSSTTA